jgi:hypothetical protein
MICCGEYHSDYCYIINLNKYNPIHMSAVYVLSYVCGFQAYAFIVLLINSTTFEGEILLQPTITPKPVPCLGISVWRTLNKILTSCHDVCHRRCVYIIRISKDTVLEYTTLYYSKSKQLLVSAVLRQPSSDRMLQKWKKKKNARAVAILLKVKPYIQDLLPTWNIRKRGVWKAFLQYMKSILKSIFD